MIGEVVKGPSAPVVAGPICVVNGPVGVVTGPMGVVKGAIGVVKVVGPVVNGRTGSTYYFEPGIVPSNMYFFMCCESKTIQLGTAGVVRWRRSMPWQNSM